MLGSGWLSSFLSSFGSSSSRRMSTEDDVVWQLLLDGDVGEIVSVAPCEASARETFRSATTGPVVGEPAARRSAAERRRGGFSPPQVGDRVVLPQVGDSPQVGEIPRRA